MKLLWVSIINNNRYRKYQFSFYVSATLASILFLFFMNVTTSLEIIFENILEENYQAKEIIVYSFKWDEEYVNQYKVNINNNIINLINQNEFVDQTSVKYRIMNELVTFKVQSFSSPIEATIKGVDTNYATFSKTEVTFAQKEFRLLDEIIVYGRDFSDKDVRSSLIDENFVYSLGINNPMDVIGTEIEIFYNGKGVIKTEIIGVFDYRLGSQPDWILKQDYPGAGQIDLNGWNSPIIVSSDVIHYFPLEITNDINSGQQMVIFDVKNLKDVETIVHLIKGYTNNDIRSSLQGAIEMITKLNNISVFAFIMSSVILTISFISIFNTTLSKVYLQKKFLKMMIVMGYTKNNIIIVYLFDHIITLLKTIITYVLLIYLITFLTEFILKPYYSSLITSIKNVFIIDIKIVLLYTMLLTLSTSLITIFSTYIQAKRYLNLS